MISYKKLRVWLAEREISGREFREMTNISQTTYTKINKNQFISMETIDRICKSLNCKISDIIEYVEADDNIE